MKQTAAPGWSEEASARYAAAKANRLSETEVSHLIESLSQHGFTIVDEYRSGANGGDWLVGLSRSEVPCTVWYDGRDAALAYRVGHEGAAHYMDTVREKVGPELLVRSLLATFQGAVQPSSATQP